MEPRSEQPGPAQPPPFLDRELLSRDLERIAAAIATLVQRRLPLPIRLALQTRGQGQGLSAMIGEDLRALLDLTDEDAATLLDALATELGALRGVRAPLRASPALQAAYRRLLEVAGAA
jgi:siroheme synthase (precorrin-2 oxidase/ferrochelatase)